MFDRILNTYLQVLSGNIPTEKDPVNLLCFCYTEYFYKMNQSCMVVIFLAVLHLFYKQLKI